MTGVEFLPGKQLPYLLIGIVSFASLLLLALFLRAGEELAQHRPGCFNRPSPHFVKIAQAVLYRGADFRVVWHEFAAISVIGLLFFAL